MKIYEVYLYLFFGFYFLIVGLNLNSIGSMLISVFFFIMGFHVSLDHENGRVIFDTEGMKK